MATLPSSSAPSSKSSKGWISNISSIAARVYFFLIILQIPLFRYWYLVHLFILSQGTQVPSEYGSAIQGS
ncbi:hypothetical protein GBA52_001087 [Prunus armeniaca]|nr:hypothetical protein GBA52_001087 [Prunus armeniaca]